MWIVVAPFIIVWFTAYILWWAFGASTAGWLTARARPHRRQPSSSRGLTRTGAIRKQPEAA